MHSLAVLLFALLGSASLAASSPSPAPAPAAETSVAATASAPAAAPAASPAAEAAFAPTAALASASPSPAGSPAPGGKARSRDDAPVPPQVLLDQAPPPSAALRTTLLPYLNIRSASVQDWSPDGRSLIITTRFGNTAQMHRVDAPIGARHQLTFFDEPVRGVRTARTREHPFLVFQRDQGGAEDFQIYRYDLDTRHTTLLTDGTSRHSSFQLSHDGRWLAFTSNARNGKDMDVWVMDPRDPESRRKLCDVKGDYSIADWARDARRLLVIEGISINESYVHEVDVASGAMKALTPKEAGVLAAYADALYAEDGKSLFVTTDRHAEQRELVRLDLASGKQQRLTASIPWSVSALERDPAGNRLAFVTNEDGISKLYLLDARTGKLLPAPQVPVGVIGTLRFDPAGTRLAFDQSTARIPSDAFVADLTTRKVVRWTESEVGGLDTSGWVEPELVHFPTFDAVEGKPREIPAFYYRPAARADGGKHPVVVLIHGGPESQVRPGFSGAIASWVNELGVAVLAPNVRGSDGYGKSYLLLDNGRKREDSVKDIGALLDWIKARPELDADRVAVQGGSYGGYMVLASMFHYPRRISCGIDVVGISHFVSFLEATRDYRRDLRRAEYGDERDPEMRKFLDSIAPLTHASEIRSPLLCLQGANDPRVPAGEAEQIVKALRKSGVEAWYVLARNEGHGFQKKDNQELMSVLVHQFFQRFLLKK